MRQQETRQPRPPATVDQTSAAALAITSDSHTRDNTQDRKRMRGE